MSGLDPNPWLDLGIAGASLLAFIVIFIVMIKYLGKRDAAFAEVVSNITREQSKEREAERQARKEDRHETLESNRRLADALDGLEKAIREKE